MILKRFSAVLLVLFAILISCGEDTSEEREAYDAVFQEVLDVHDQLMVRMTDIYEYSKALKQHADTSAAPQKFMETRDSLQEVDDHMMQWMEDFGNEFVKNKSELKTMNREQLQARTNSLKEELDEVKAMQSKMTKTLDRAKTLTD